MSRIEIEFLADRLDSAFQRRMPEDWSAGWHSLLSNLQSVRDEDLDWLPPGGVRSIRHIAAHSGISMLVYSDHGFGAGLMQWPDQYPHEVRGSKEQIISWLTECHKTLSNALAACTDEQLDEVRETWDPAERWPRRWFVTTMVDHLLYHSGEINYIRALAQKNDE